MKRINKKFTIDSDVSEILLFDENDDSISFIPVLYEEQNHFIGTVRSNGKVVYRNIYRVNDSDKFFKEAEAYCHNNSTKSFFNLISAFKEKVGSSEQYMCDYNEAFYCVHSNKKADAKCKFGLSNYFKAGSDSNATERQSAAKQMFLILGFATAIVEALDEESMVVGFHKHDGGNELASYIISAVNGRQSSCEIKNPKECHQRLDANSMFSFHGTGSKLYDFGKTVEYINTEYQGCYAFMFDCSNAFPFDVRNRVIKYNTFLIQEDFDFSESESDMFYQHCDNINYLSLFRQFLTGQSLEEAYTELKKKYSSDSEFAFRNDIVRRMAIIELCCEQVRNCFDVTIDTSKVCALVKELSLTEPFSSVHSADEIIKNIITSCERNAIYIANDKNDKMSIFIKC